MDNDILSDESIADLERLHKKLSERIDRLVIARDGIQATLDALNKPMQPQLFSLNGNGHTEKRPDVVNDDEDTPNTDLVASFLAVWPAREFTTTTAFKAFNKAHPDRLLKRQFRSAFRKVKERSSTPVVLVRARPGNVPSVYRWQRDTPNGARG